MNGVRDGSRPASRGERGLRRRAVRAAAGLAIGGIMMVHLVPAAREPAGRYAMHEEAGRWLRETAGAGRRVMAETPVVTYYAGAAFEVLPYAPMEDVLYFARQRGVEYLVVDSAGVERNRPQLVRWLNPWSRHPGLEVVRTFRHGRTRALHVYRLEDLPGR